jgi:hypothetical protein
LAVVAILAALILAGLVTAQVKSRQARMQLLAEKQLPNKEEPTPVQEGVMTGRQKKHAKLFKGYGASRKVKLADLPSETGEVNVQLMVGDMPLPRSFNLAEYLQQSACAADAVIIGTVSSKASQLTEDGSFTFTDYEVKVVEVLKDNPAAPIQADGSVTVTRAGGAVRLNGRTLRATDFAEKSLEANGRFLLFLKYLPETGAYRPYIGSVGDASFQLRGEKILQVSDEVLPLGAHRVTDAAPFLAEVRSAAGGCGRGE